VLDHGSVHVVRTCTEVPTPENQQSLCAVVLDVDFEHGRLAAEATIRNEPGTHDVLAFVRSLTGEPANDQSWVTTRVYRQSRALPIPEAREREQPERGQPDQDTTGRIGAEYRRYCHRNATGGTRDQCGCGRGPRQA